MAAKTARRPPGAAGDDRRVIFLARHGETEWNRIGRWQGATDIPLSDVGRAQARALGERLLTLGIRRIHASHLTRARETAEIVAATLSDNPAVGLNAFLPVNIDARLCERGYGCFEGLTRDECAARYPDVWERYLGNRRLVPPDAEPQESIVARVTEAMQDVAAAIKDGAPALVISHGGSIRTFVHAATGITLPPLGNGAVVSLRATADGGFVVAAEIDLGDPALRTAMPG